MRFVEFCDLIQPQTLAFQWRARDFLALAMALRQSGYAGHITAGGHFATFAAREILSDFPELDSICRQESEETLVSLVRAVERGTPLKSISGMALRNERGQVFLTAQPSLPDLARVPWPDRSGEPAMCFGRAIAPRVGSRGCYANCTFCCIAAWHEETQPGKRYRLGDVGDIADEMVFMQRQRGIDIFVFHDDNFFRNQEIETVMAHDASVAPNKPMNPAPLSRFPRFARRGLSASR